MVGSIGNILTENEIEEIITNPTVVEAQAQLLTKNVVSFSAQLSENIRNTLSTKLEIDLSSVTSVPMRWIKNDTTPHIDRGSTQFNNTYLVYLTDGPGNLILGESSYPIQKNTAYVFSQGTSHGTSNTNGVPRLLIGPMNEFGAPVGQPVGIYYFLNEANALSYTNFIQSSNSYTVGDTTYFRLGFLNNGLELENTRWVIQNTNSPASGLADYYTNTVGDTPEMVFTSDSTYFNVYPYISPP